MRNEIKEALGVPEIRQYEKYLGLPSFVGKSKRASFDYIKERVWRKLQGWEESLLSQAGPEVLAFYLHTCCSSGAKNLAF